MRLARFSAFLSFSILLAAGWPALLYAQTYISPFVDAEWNAQSGPFACSLEHKIPGFGVARLQRNAGSAETLELTGKSQHFNQETVRIEAVPPAWRGDITSVNLGSGKATGRSLRLNAQQAAAITASLDQGTNVIFSGSTLRVGLESRNFTKAFAGYKRCVKNLIPYTFNQLSRVQLNYAGNADVLSPTAKSQLDKIVRYVKADKKVLGIIVDGHSDKQEKPEDAEAYAKSQAELVTAYLVEKGVAADKVATRWHGDRFPIADNQSKSGRAKNRRVTVRLENAATREQMEKKLAAIKEAEQKAAAEKAAADAKAEAAAGAETDAKAPTLKTQENPVPTIDPAELEKLTEEMNLIDGAQLDGSQTRSAASARSAVSE